MHSIAAAATTSARRSSFLYRAILKRNSTFWATSVAIAFVADVALDATMQTAWEAHNYGVRAHFIHLSLRSSGSTLSPNMQNFNGRNFTTMMEALEP